MAVAMFVTPRRAAGSLSLDLQPVTKRSAALSLSEGSARRAERRKAGSPLLRFSGFRRSSRRLPFVVGRIDIGARQKPEQPVGRLAGLGSGAHDGAIVLAQHLEPGADIVGMADGGRDAERGAAESRVDLGDQLLEGVFLRAEGTREIAVQA